MQYGVYLQFTHREIPPTVSAIIIHDSAHNAVNRARGGPMPSDMFRDGRIPRSGTTDPLDPGSKRILRS